MSRFALSTLAALRLRRLSEQPGVSLRPSRWLFVILLLLGPLLLLVPWRQTVPGSGRVVAFSPTERQQDIHAPVSGRIVRWHVVEGSRVKMGDPIVDMMDIDPLYLSRVEERIAADRQRVEAAEDRLRVYEAQVDSYDKARQMKVRAMHLKAKMADQKLEVARQKANVAASALETAESNLSRTRSLESKGISSERQLELAQLTYATAEADYKLRQAEVLEAEAQQLAARAEVQRADAEAGAKVETARAEAKKASAEAAYAKGDLAKLRVDKSRQLAQSMESPVDGTVVRIDGNLGGGVVSAGQHLATIIPDTDSRAVEVYVDGNDAPLITRGATVRLQFEGWPALQFVGWPGAAVGTFGGQVSFVDPAAMDAAGRVRVLVVPDDHEDVQSWPPPHLLRQQVRARAWFLLDDVSLGWELWRRINGFPPSLPGMPDANPKDAQAEPAIVAKKGSKK